MIIRSCEDCSLCGIVFPQTYGKKTLITAAIYKILEVRGVRRGQVGGMEESQRRRHPSLSLLLFR